YVLADPAALGLGPALGLGQETRADRYGIAEAVADREGHALEEAVGPAPVAIHHQVELHQEAHLDAPTPGLVDQGSVSRGPTQAEAAADVDGEATAGQVLAGLAALLGLPQALLVEAHGHLESLDQAVAL